MFIAPTISYLVTCNGIRLDLDQLPRAGDGLQLY